MSPSRGWIDPFAGVPGKRLFVAVPLPAEAAAAVTAMVDEVRAAPLPDGMRDVRWVRLDGLHVTLRFLGPTPDSRLAATNDAIHAAGAAGRPIRASIEGAGAFPDPRRPRTLWVGIAEGREEFAGLARTVEDQLEAAGWPRSDRPFRAHLTLARSDGLPAGAIVTARLAAAMADRRISFDADRLALFESVTGGGPARYVPVTTAGLGATADVGSAVYHRTNP